MKARKSREESVAFSELQRELESTFKNIPGVHYTAVSYAIEALIDAKLQRSPEQLDIATDIDAKPAEECWRCGAEISPEYAAAGFRACVPCYDAARVGGAAREMLRFLGTGKSVPAAPAVPPASAGGEEVAPPHDPGHPHLINGEFQSDAEFSADLELALTNTGYVHGRDSKKLTEHTQVMGLWCGKCGLDQRNWPLICHGRQPVEPPPPPPKPVAPPDAEALARRMIHEYVCVFRARGGLIAYPEWNERGEADRAAWLSVSQMVSELENARVAELESELRKMAELVAAWRLVVQACEQGESHVCAVGERVVRLFKALPPEQRPSR